MIGQRAVARYAYTRTRSSHLTISMPDLHVCIATYDTKARTYQHTHRHDPFTSEHTPSPHKVTYQHTDMTHSHTSAHLHHTKSCMDAGPYCLKYHTASSTRSSVV